MPPSNALSSSINEDTLPERIAENILTDEHEQFRLRCFEILAQAYTDHKSFAKVVDTAIEAYQYPRLRFRAAQFHPKDSFQTMRALAVDGSNDTDLRTEAIEYAAKIAAPDAVGQLAVACLNGPMIPIAIRIISQVGYRPGIEPIIELINTSDATNGAFADAHNGLIMSTLCRFGGPLAFRGIALIFDSSTLKLSDVSKQHLVAAEEWNNRLPGGKDPRQNMAHTTTMSCEPSVGSVV